MKLLGRDIDGTELLKNIEGRLKARGFRIPPATPPRAAAEFDPRRVDPISYNVESLEAHVDATRPLPLQTHRKGLGQGILLVKWAFRKSCQVLINETLARQRLFNTHVYQAYAELSAEVVSLKHQLRELQPRVGGGKASSGGSRDKS